MSCDLLLWRFGNRRIRLAGCLWLKIEQMLLAFSLNDPLASSTKDPLLQAIEFNNRGLMRRFELFMGGSRCIEHTLQLGSLLD